MNVEIRALPEKRVASVAHRGPYDTIWRAFEQLGKLTEAARWFETKAPVLVGIYYDDPTITPPAELRSDAGVVVGEDVSLPPGLTEIRIARGRYAVTTHVGPYQKLPVVWARFMGEWLPASGHRMGRGATFELYLNTPLDARPEDLKTELYVPLAD
jgi:AraC family transcriptional regulator